MRTEILRLHANGTAVIFSTHRMEQVEELCEFIVLIDRGKNILQGKVHDIRRQFVEHRYHLDYGGTLPDALGQRYELLNPTPQGIDIQLQEGEDSNDLLRNILNLGIPVHGFRELLPSLNDIFIKRVTRLKQ
jgi:ABC-2 type transport system ATP-binding protein